MNKYKLVLYVAATLIFVLLCVTAIVTIPPAIVVRGLAVFVGVALIWSVVDLSYYIFKGKRHD